MKKILTFFLIVFSSMNVVNAASICSYQEQSEINQKAANIKAGYEIITEQIPHDEQPNEMVTTEYFKISITNITDDFYVIVKNNYNSDQITLTSAEAENGIVSFKWEDNSEIVNFTIDVYTTNNTSCPDEIYKTIYVTTPRYNWYSVTDVCKENPDFQYCQKYLTVKDIDYNDFDKRIAKFIKKNETNDKNDDKGDSKITDKIFTFFDNYKWIILGSVVIIGSGIFITIRIKNKKQRDLGL